MRAVALALLAFGLWAAPAWAASEGPNATACSPGSECAGTNWTDPTNVASSNDAWALYDNTAKDYIIITGFGFSTSGTINGVEVFIEGHGVTGPAARRTIDVNLTKDGSAECNAGGEKSQAMDATTDNTYTLGTSADLWSCTLSAAEVNTDASFGVMIRDTNTSAHQLDIDQVTITVHFTAATTTSTSVTTTTSTSSTTVAGGRRLITDAEHRYHARIVGLCREEYLQCVGS